MIRQHGVQCGIYPPHDVCDGRHAGAGGRGMGTSERAGGDGVVHDGIHGLLRVQRARSIAFTWLFC